MHLQQRLLKKVLDENYIDDGSPILHTFNVKEKKYHLTTKHLNGLKALAKGMIENGIELDDERFYMAGGSVLTLLMYGSPLLIRDVDIFPRTEQDYNKLKTKLDAKVKEYNIIDTERSRCYDVGNYKIDLIKKYSATIEECLGNFDLNVVRVGFDEKFNFKALTEFFEIFNFRLKIMTEVNSSNVAQRLKRVLKYTNKGFNLKPAHFVGLLATMKTGEAKYKKDAEGLVNVNEKWEKEYQEIYNEISPSNNYKDLDENNTILEF